MNLILSTVHGLEMRQTRAFSPESFAATKSDAKMHLFVAQGELTGSIKRMEATGAVIHPFSYLSFRQRQPLLYLWPVWRRMLAGRSFCGKMRLGETGVPPRI